MIPSLNYDRTLSIYVIIKEPKVKTMEILEKYLKYNKLFSDELEIGLPEHLRWDYEIKLQPNKKLKFYKVYPQNLA